MMNEPTITIKCPGCQSILKVLYSARGKNFNCPTCNKTLLVSKNGADKTQNAGKSKSVVVAKPVMSANVGGQNVVTPANDVNALPTTFGIEDRGFVSVNTTLNQDSLIDTYRPVIQRRRQKLGFAEGRYNLGMRFGFMLVFLGFIGIAATLLGTQVPQLGLLRDFTSLMAMGVGLVGCVLIGAFGFDQTAAMASGAVLALLLVIAGSLSTVLQQNGFITHGYASFEPDEEENNAANGGAANSTLQNKPGAGTVANKNSNPKLHNKFEPQSLSEEKAIPRQSQQASKTGSEFGAPSGMKGRTPSTMDVDNDPLAEEYEEDMDSHDNVDSRIFNDLEERFRDGLDRAKYQSIGDEDFDADFMLGDRVGKEGHMGRILFQLAPLAGVEFVKVGDDSFLLPANPNPTAGMEDHPLRINTPKGKAIVGLNLNFNKTINVVVGVQCVFAKRSDDDNGGYDMFSLSRSEWIGQGNTEFFAEKLRTNGEAVVGLSVEIDDKGVSGVQLITRKR